MLTKDCTAAKVRIALALNQWEHHRDNVRTLQEISPHLREFRTLINKGEFLAKLDGLLIAGNLDRARKLVFAVLDETQPTLLLVCLGKLFDLAFADITNIWPRVFIAAIIAIVICNL